MCKRRRSDRKRGPGRPGRPGRGLTDHPQKRQRTWPEKGRRRRQRTAVLAAARRRVAVWRSRMLNGERQVVYVTLGGDVLVKGREAFKAATADEKYLKASGVSRPKSSIEVPEERVSHREMPIAIKPEETS